MNTLYVNSGSSRSGKDDGEFTASDMLKLLRDHIGMLMLFIAGAALLATAYAFLAKPIYSADVIIRVDPPDPNALGITPQNQQQMQQQAQTVNQIAPAEISVMQSRSVLEPVVKQFHFDIKAKPRTLPVLGQIADLFAKRGQLSPAWLGLDSYGWGGEELNIGRLDVPASLEDSKLDFVLLDKNQYELRDEDGDVLVRGTVGRPAAANGVSMLVDSVVGHPGVHFDVIRYNTLDAIALMLKTMKVTESAKDTGIVQISFNADDPELTANVANALGQAYMSAAVASRQANDTKTLEFIRGELPRLEADLKTAEGNLSAFRSKSQSVQPVNEAQAYLQGSITSMQQLAMLQLQRTQALQRFQPDSPQVKNLDQQIAQFEATNKQIQSRFDSMPASERQSAELTRDARVAETIYLGMMNKAEELSVRRASTSGGAHILDNALRPHRPVKPNKMLVILAGTGLGFFVGTFFIFLRRHAMIGVTDPMFVERRLSVPVLGEVLFSRQQLVLDHEIAVSPVGRALGFSGTQQNGAAPKALPHYDQAQHDAMTMPHVDERDEDARVLASRFPHDPAVEALRAVRTELYRDLVNAPNNIVMLTGPIPSAGKSFVAANLAVLLAEIGLKVLLIDADMRRGHIASFFKQSNPGGLAEVLKGDIGITDALRYVGVPGLSFMSCGGYPQNPSELLMMPRFRDMLARMSDQFDLVLVDTPPFLAVTDAAIVASDAGSTVLVLRSGIQTEEEIEETVKKVQRAGGRLVGSVFNAIPRRRSNRRSYGYAAAYTSSFKPVN
ncbi:polysaccharide biosynthesis tyrosine autokinase [Caballeronia sp. LP006]|uniref:polysaccharide biosynthesis tyrosine autokinase n=1 Tax=unclassified Caballeronia TaxID=2646786 RepID=UPI001FD3526F|nr:MULTISPECIES: polysaccharide biosynthesis tyrosine autokinase [unclassified Caballeronia]MDR5776031.1 polysaccharide biosynthesis tyrosine autokinase [Caballeronia sp. LZ002]MDR5800940.1 polysaccharide biosynthesis tyrosine autokinase [Caballeronia sp. LZ001]MDR5829132.1 polysaccharide biosynthesis tyrosine autokinase [Caballeronia sp. LP006]